ncbi:hypothetical protein ACLKA6_007493 [Drosophila palustris]
MSALSTRRTSLNSRRGSRKSQLTSLSLSYDIYCINFYDNGLTAVRDEYINQIKLGLRRFLFVVDLDNEVKQAFYTNEVNKRSSKIKKAEPLPTEPIELALKRIQDCLDAYEYVTKRIDSENSFNLFKYYQKYVPADLKFKLVDPKKDKAAMESKRPPKSKDTTETLTKNKIVCFGVTAKEHNKVGKGKPLSKRAYIKDQPATTSILILIIGTLNNEFYKTLIAYNQPLRGIIHFLPEECAYDLLVPRPRRLKELRESIEKIQRDIHSLRKRSQTKTIGIFQQQLPQMSKCQATKYASEVFDQLCWFIYDVQTLREHYDEYYVKPYNEIDVKMSPKTSVQEAYHLAESLHIGGHYLNHELPAVDNDDATVYIYLESLMNTFGPPRELMTEVEVLLLANPSSLVQTRVLDKIKVYANAFKSIIKLIKSERLFVEHGNQLLMNVISYMDQKLMRNIYHACLEYNILRRYFCTGYSVDSLQLKPFTDEVEPRYLPKYAKLYLTDDAVTQRIIQLVDEFENYKVEEIHPNIKLYTFRRCLHEVFEHQKEIVIPSRLCFRDFTLYEMENFLKDLVTIEMFDSTINDVKGNLTSEYPSNHTLDETTDAQNQFNCQSKKQYVVTPSVFIRPKSLKANKVAEQIRDQMREKEKAERPSARGTKLRNQSARNSNNKSRSNIGLTQQSSSFEENTSGKQQHSFIGLGPDHPLLTGYNLDDTRQTIKVKTSKYHFEEGLMTLYQEKWNFRQLNKYLSIEIDKHNIHLTNERGDMNKISNNIRIQTPSGIHLRIRPNTDECAKAVLNYPNGLTLYCHDTHSEHLWSGNQSELNESRRICTPYGCVIVFYNGNDTILIMRYNGEVYRLYSCEDVMEEQEGEEEETSDFVNACSTQSTYSSYKPLIKEQDRDSASRLSRKKSKTPPTTRESGGSDKKGKKKSQRSSDSTSSQTLAVKAAKAQAREMKLNQTAALFASIDNELKYLELIMGLYDISYVHLKLTTSLGSVVHVEKQDKIYCAKPIRVTEWHDYYANESYAMRDDGVRMVWTQDTLKCYHTDGTVINTTTVGGVDVGIIEDEIDKQISSSSSHEENFSEEGSMSMQSDDIYINMQASSVKNYGSKAKNIGLDEFLAEGEVEDEYSYDYSFETYTANSFLIQHRSYAGTQFNFTNISEMETKVLAADNLQFRIYPIPNDQNYVDKLDENQINDALQERMSSEADPDEWTRFSEPKSPPKILPHLSPGVEVEASNLRLSLERDNLELHAQLRKFGCDENEPVVRDHIELKLNLNENLSITFRNWVEAFHQFIKCACPKWKTTYFIESLTEDCRKKGLELFKSVPTLGEFNFCAGNYYIDPEELKSIHARMVNNFIWYEQDMEKFPRFSPQKKPPQTVEFPTVLTTKIFVEIPAQLAYTDRIHLFLNPFDKIKFRKLKHRFNEAVLFHLYPHLRGLVKQEISKRSWRNHHLVNKRRLFMEQQRLSLYVAMLKHKVYPNYFQFKDNFYNHVRNIDFFEFMSSKCNEKDNPDKYIADKTEEGSKPKAHMSTDLKKHRKKCPCPKYIKSLS